MKRLKPASRRTAGPRLSAAAPGNLAARPEERRGSEGMDSRIERLGAWGCDVKGALNRMLDDEDFYL